MTDRQYRNRIAKIDALKTEIAQLNDQVNALQDEIKAAMGDAEQYTTEDGHNIFWRWKKGAERFDKAAFGKAHPALLKQYTTVGEPTRAFSITKPKTA